MGPHRKEDLTEVLRAVGSGDQAAEQALYRRVLEELRSLAHRQLGKELRRHTLLQTNDLVNEAYVKLFGSGPRDWKCSRYFYGAAVNAMKQILTDYGRRLRADKRGGGMPRVTLSEGAAAEAPSFEILSLNEALDRLSTVQARAARVVESRFLLGLTIQETARLLEVSEKTVTDDWNFASAWLHREISSTPDSA
jgi:RNA polymerase sigma factor (TIGR02999 family)